ncbi:MAG TPA: hypothetical protein VHA13_05990 [Gammaproteobacteria bacterium]|nr:hypothetical protein [Gammaproteobacteria bacterium]
MFGHNDPQSNLLKVRKQNYLLNYDYSKNEFNWDTASLGEMDIDDLELLDKQLFDHENVIHLNLSGSKLGKNDEAFRKLANLLVNNLQIESIDLSNNDLEDKHLTIIRETLSTLFHYQSFNLANNPKLTINALTLLDDMDETSPFTIISLVSGNRYFDTNTSEEGKNIYQDALLARYKLEEKSKQDKLSFDKFLKDPNNFSNSEIDCSGLGPFNKESIQHLSHALKPYKNVHGLNFFLDVFGRKSGTVDALIELLRENPQINSVSLNSNYLLDHHIEKIVRSLPPERLQNLYINTCANRLTKKSLQAVHGLMDPLTEFAMLGNKIDENDPEVKKMIEEAELEYERRSKQDPAPSTSLNSQSSFFAGNKKQEEQTTANPKENLFEEKTNESLFQKSRSINRSK